jgi:ATP-dependent helicase HrpB
MLDEAGTVTPLGEAALKLGEHPRIAHMLLRAKETGLGYEAALLTSILSERPSLESGDLREGMEEIHRGLAKRTPSLRRLQASVNRTLKVIQTEIPDTPESHAAGMLIALAYPERIALRRGKGERYLGAGGRGMRLRAGDPLQRYELLAVAEAGGEGNEAAIRLAAPVTREELDEIGLIEERTELKFNADSGRVEARKLIGCDGLILESRPLPLPDSGEVAKALLEGIRQAGLETLPWSPESRRLLHRVRCARHHLGALWPDWSDEALLKRLEEWLLPWMEGIDSLRDLAKLDLSAILEADLNWERKSALDRLLPDALALPSGRSVFVDYTDPGTPTLSARLQECFGWSETPAVLEGRLPLTIRLLSPARRPLAVTRDLESFWRHVYPEVRREMRGRYPKHYWPEDPFTATAETKHMQIQKP